MPNLAIGQDGLSTRQRDIFKYLFKIAVVESNLDLLKEMVRDHGQTLLYYSFGDITKTLRTMIVENKIFNTMLNTKKECSIPRWSTGGPLEPYQAVNELMEHKIFASYLEWQRHAKIFPFGNITKMFVVAYQYANMDEFSKIHV